MSIASSAQLASLKGQEKTLSRIVQREIEKTRQLLTSTVQDGDESQIMEDLDVQVSVLLNHSTRYEAFSQQMVNLSEQAEIDEEEIENQRVHTMELLSEITTWTSKATTYQKAVHRRLKRAPSATISQSTAVSSPETLLAPILERLIDLQNQGNSTSNASNNTGGSTVIKLPKIEMPKYDGNVLKWSEFWDSFNSAVHSNPRLAPVDKLNYLRGQLTGIASSSISGLPINNDNYLVAINLLRSRFGNAQVAINTHYNCLTDLMMPPNDTLQIRKFYDQLEQHLRCLAAFGEECNHRYFVSLVMKKLPKDVVIKLEETKDKATPWSVDLLRQNLHSHLTARESAERVQRADEKVRDNTWNTAAQGGWRKNGVPRYCKPNENSRLTTSTEALLAKSQLSTNGSRIAMQCVYYTATNHWSDECSRYKTTEERKKALGQRCYICLRKNHRLTNCRIVKPCFYCGVVKNHHRSLCPRKFTGTSNQETSAMASEFVTAVVDEVSGPQASGQQVLLQTAKLKLNTNEGKLPQIIRTALFDSGSNRSYITDNLAKNLNLKLCQGDHISLNRFGTDKTKIISTNVAQIGIQLLDGCNKTLTVNVVPQISGPMQRVPVKLTASTRGLWENLPLADSFPRKNETSHIDVLIGNDYYLDLITGEKIQIQNGLYLLGSQVGWILTGRAGGTEENRIDVFNSAMCAIHQCSSDKISPEPNTSMGPDPSLIKYENFENYWNLETIGIKDSPEYKDDSKAIKMFQDTVTFEKDRYYVGWPWKESQIEELPENYNLAFSRLASLTRKLSRDPELLAMYNKIIEDQLVKGIIKRVDSKTIQGPKKQYIPHQAVVTPLKTTTKVRIVYDASARAGKLLPTLNECICRGPVYMEDLCGLLMRFRLEKVAIVADIEKAFLQIGLQTADRDVTRFLWLRDPTKNSLQNNIQVYRFARIPFGVIASPFLLGATVDYHLGKTGTPFAEKMRTNMYVDNVALGVGTEIEATQLYLEAKETFKKASMNLREWLSNSESFMRFLPDNDRVKSNEVKVLGLTWNSKQDCLSVHEKESKEISSVTTKRTVMKSLASIFDPLGFFLPVTSPGKVMLQDLWKENVQWDEPLTEPYVRRWETIMQDLKEIPKCKVLRYIGNKEDPEENEFQLHCFSDASLRHYAAVVYLRVSSTQSTSVKLVLAKSRLNPTKPVSIPRLELLGVLIGVRFLKFVEKELRLPITKLHLWSDSQCVLHWLKSSKSSGVFVDNRVREINTHKNIVFRYVHTSENPADLATRGTSVTELPTLWWNGPGWLQQSEENWPKLKECDLENTPKVGKEVLRMYEAGLSTNEAPIKRRL